MPRKSYQPKNRFCTNSRLSEGVFLLLLRGFCYGRSASNAAQITSDWAVRNGYKKISRETVSKYFIALGSNLFYSYDEASEFDDDYLDTLWEMVYYEHEVDYSEREELNQIGLFAYINTLQKMSKINNGLSKKYFKSHFGHAIFLTVASQEHGDECTSYLYNAMINKLEKNPLTI